jgi:hypothetical protein
VYTFKTNNKKVDYTKNCILSKYDNLFSCNDIFNKIYWLSRKGEEKIWNILKFYKYYKKTVNNYKGLVGNFSSCDNLFIFSDKEKPVEILALLMKEKFKPNVYLIDEGIVSYSYKRNYLKKIIKWLIVHLFRFKYIGNNYNYGGSNIFDYFITYDKRKIATPIKGNIIEIYPLDFSVLRPYINIPKFSRKSVLYISSPISEIRYSKEKELLNVKRIVKYWNKLGYMVLLKLHPLEDINKFKSIISHTGIIMIEDKNIPPEIFFNEVEFITGLFSSALLNASRLPNKIVLSYNPYFGWGDNEETRSIGNEHSINFIADLSDIDNIIKSPEKYCTKEITNNKNYIFEIINGTK